MAVDWSALTQRLARLLEPKYMAALTWTQTAQIVQGLSDAQKASIVQAIKDGRAQTVGELITSAVGQQLAASATSEAQAMLVDQSLTTAELDRLFG